MVELLKLLALPVLQSILASRMDEALRDLAADNTMPSFEKAMKEAFVEAVKKVKGDAPKTVQIALEDEYGYYREALLKDVRTFQQSCEEGLYRRQSAGYFQKLFACKEGGISPCQ